MRYPLFWHLMAAELLAPVLAEAADFSLSFQAPEGCSSRELMIQEILARTDTARLASDASGYAFSASLARAEVSGYFGKLTILPQGGPPSVRDVDGQSCEEVVSALALIAALTLDPQARLGPVVVEKAPPPLSEEALPGTPPNLPPLAEVQAGQWSSVPREQASPIQLVLPSPARGQRPARELAREPRRIATGRSGPPGPPHPPLMLALGAHAAYLTQLAPHGMIVAGFDGALRRADGLRAQLSFELGPSDTQATDRGERAAYFYWGAELLAGWRMTTLDSFALDLGWLLAAGLLRGRAEEGGRISRAVTARTRFVGTGPSAQLTWHSSGVTVGLGAAGTTALSRPTFELDAGDNVKEEFFGAPAFGGMARLEALIEL